MRRPRFFAANEGLALVLEIVALAALGWWGWHVGTAIVVRLLFAIAAPLVAAVVWGIFAAPKAALQVPLAAQLAVKALVFAAATLALVAVGRWPLAVVFALVVLANTVAATIWRNQGHSLLKP